MAARYGGIKSSRQIQYTLFGRMLPFMLMPVRRRRSIRIVPAACVRQRPDGDPGSVAWGNGAAACVCWNGTMCTADPAVSRRE